MTESVDEAQVNIHAVTAIRTESLFSNVVAPSMRVRSYIGEASLFVFGVLRTNPPHDVLFFGIKVLTRVLGSAVIIPVDHSSEISTAQGTPIPRGTSWLELTLCHGEP